MTTVKQKMVALFPELAEMPNLIEDAVEALMEHAMENDEAAGAGFNMMVNVVNGDVSEDILRFVVDMVMSREAGHMIDAMRGVIYGKLLEGLDEDNPDHFFRIHNAYNGLDNAGLL